MMNKDFKKRNGIATIIGTILFIGIMFSSIIPMYISMKQADTVYDQKLIEMNRLDQERQRENVAVSSFPTSVIGNTITVEAYNIGSADVKLVRVWINDKLFTLDPPKVVKPFMKSTLGYFNPGIANMSMDFDTTLVSDKGNVFADPYTLSYIWYEGGGFWDVDAILVNVLIDAGNYKNPPNENYLVQLNYNVNGTWALLEESSIAMKGGATIKPHDVTVYGFGQVYQVLVYKNNKNNPPIADEIVEIGNTNIHWVTAYGYK